MYKRPFAFLSDVIPFLVAVVILVIIYILEEVGFGFCSGRETAFLISRYKNSGVKLPEIHKITLILKIMALPLVASDEYVEPTKGMTAMRVRILRAELQAGCSISAYDAEHDGEEVVTQMGTEAYPRTTSTGASFSVTVSQEQNGTFARSIRAGGWVFLSRDGSRHPLHPTAYGVRLHPRRGRERLQPNVLLPEDFAEPVVIRDETVSSSNSWLAHLRNAMWTASTAISTGAATIITMIGANAGRGSAMVFGMFMLLGTSEMTEYPIVSTMWNHTEPLFVNAGIATMETLSNAAELASDGVKSGVRYVGLLICGIVAFGLVVWLLTIWLLELAIRRTKKMTQAWSTAPQMSEKLEPVRGELNASVSASLPHPTSQAQSCMSGPTSGEESGDDVTISALCMCRNIIYDNNCLRSMSNGPCKQTAWIKTDLMHGDSLVARNGNLISHKDGRIEVGLRKQHHDQYLERRKDVGCEQEGCYARGVLVKFGGKAIRECSERIGKRLLTEPKEADHVQTDAPVSEGLKRSTGIAKGTVLVVNDDGSVEPDKMAPEIDMQKTKQTSTEPTESKQTKPDRQCTDDRDVEEALGRKEDEKKTSLRKAALANTANQVTVDKPARPCPNVISFEDPADTDGTSSDAEEEMLGEIWNDKKGSKKLMLDTSDFAGNSKKRKESSRQKCYDSDSDFDRRKQTGSKRRDQSSSSSSTSSSSDDHSTAKSRGKKSGSGKSDRRGSVSSRESLVPDFTQRPTSKATRPPVRLQVDPEICSVRRSKWDKMAGAMRELMEKKTNKDENPRTTKMQKFATFAMRGFGNFSHVLAVGSYGEDLIASVKRCIDARGNTPIAAGIRFPITHRLLKASVKMDFGTINTGKEVEGSTMLADFPYWSKERLERYRLGTEKDDIPRGKLPQVIAEFVDAAKQETKYLELLYGEEHAPDRLRAITFFEQLHRDNPDLYTVPFGVET